MRKHTPRSGIPGDTQEVGIVRAGPSDLVQGGTDAGRVHAFDSTLDVAECGAGARIPGHAETVDGEVDVARCDLFFGCGAGVDGAVVGEEEREVVVGDLLGNGVLGC